MSLTWIIADTHFGKQPRDRVKASGRYAEELDEMIAAAWRSAVQPADQVWHLGDVGNLGMIETLPGVKRLIKGNDDTKRDCVASGAFVDVQSRCLVDGIELVHRPEDASSDGVVFHGHLHARVDARPNFVCLSVDQTGFAPVSWNEAVLRSFEQLDRALQT
jgi:calcineurin-like phosphoesterase family protein